MFTLLLRIKWCTGWDQLVKLAWVTCQVTHPACFGHVLLCRPSDLPAGCMHGCRAGPPHPPLSACLPVYVWMDVSLSVSVDGSPTSLSVGVSYSYHVQDAFSLLTDGLQMLPQVLKKDGEHVDTRGMWDALRRGTSQVVFSDLTEVVKLSLRCFSLNCHIEILHNKSCHVVSFL